MTIDDLIGNYLSFWEHFFLEQGAINRGLALALINEVEDGQLSQRPDAEMIMYQDQVAEVYGAYENARFQLLTAEVLLGHTQLSKEFMPDRHLVSLGCGPASFELWLSKNQGPRQLTLIDQSSAMLQRAREIAQELGIEDRAAFIQADAIQSNLPNNCADIVFCLNSMHWSANWRKWITEAARIAKPGAVIFFTCTLLLPRSKIERKQFETEVRRFFADAVFGSIVPPEFVGQKMFFSGRYYGICRKGRRGAVTIKAGKKKKKK